MNDLIGGISILMLVFGIVEALKTQLNLSTKWAFFVALLLGVVFAVLNQAMLQFPLASPWVEAVVKGIAYALAATGFYDFGKNFIERPVNRS